MATLIANLFTASECAGNILIEEIGNFVSCNINSPTNIHLFHSDSQNFELHNFSTSLLNHLSQEKQVHSTIFYHDSNKSESLERFESLFLTIQCKPIKTILTSLNVLHFSVYGPFNIIILNNLEEEDIKMTLNLMRNQSVKTSTIVFLTPVDNLQMSILESSLAECNDNFLFYMVSMDQTTDWKLVLTVKNQPQVVINQLTFQGIPTEFK